jgi:hypothetical protein
MATRRATKTPKKTAKPPSKKAPKKTAKASPERPAAPRTKAAPKRSPAAPARTEVLPGRVVVHNVNVPGYETTVEAPRYEAMKKALLQVLPTHAPGLTQAEMFASVVPHLPAALFPGGAKAGWWAKCVQLDLEARGLVVRDAAKKPVRWRKTWPTRGKPRGARY